MNFFTSGICQIYLFPLRFYISNVYFCRSQSKTNVIAYNQEQKLNAMLHAGISGNGSLRRH